jgi:hypothetical protein
MASENILMWNVRGLNARAHHNAVRQLVLSEKVSLVCLQEIKVETISNYDVIQRIGTNFDYVYLPTVQTCGGILVAWCGSSWVVTDSSYQPFSISVRLCQASGGPEWWLTMVYGPCRGVDKQSFLAELHELRHVQTGPWLLGGDFNMIYRAKDKSND